MIKTRSLTSEGLTAFAKWLENPAKEASSNLISGDVYSEDFGNFEIDPSHQFSSRFEFGKKLNEWFKDADFHQMMSAQSDGFWAWLALVYFEQLTAKGIRRSEHYIVLRKGPMGSLAYRHAVRTPYELFHIHGDYSQICLRSRMHTLGELTEQLTSRQQIAHHRGFFQTATELYVKNGSLKSGASSKPNKPKYRKPGERTGFGSARRLAIALQRLDLTYDTEEMLASQMKQVLPKEFQKYAE